MTKSIIICASGNSISEGRREGLFTVLPWYTTIGINYFAYYGIEPTFTTFVDYTFYLNNAEWLEGQKLVIGKHDPQLIRRDCVMSNTLLLPKSKAYTGVDAWTKGFYGSHLSGIFSLSLAIALGYTEIYLLGFDCCAVEGQTHFYQDQVQGDTKFTGVGQVAGQYKTSTYNNITNLNNKYFKPFENIPGIYNVSPNSAITVFPKISYQEFLAKEKPICVDQDKERKAIRDFIVERYAK